MTQQLHQLKVASLAFPDVELGPQNQRLIPAVHSGIAEIENLSSGVVRMPGRHQALPHVHQHSAITVYVRHGMVASLVGEDMTPLLHAPGSVVYIGPNIAHVGLNLDPVEDAEVFETRTDPAFNRDVVRRVDLEVLAQQRAEALQRDYVLGRLASQLATPTVHAVTWRP